MTDDKDKQQHVIDFLSEEAREMSEEIGDAQVTALARDELEKEERDALLKKLARSPDAVQRYRHAMDRQVDATSAKWKPILKDYRIAASVLLVAVFVSFVWQPTLEEPTYRGTALRTAVPADNGVLESLPDHFAWGRQPGAERYRVLLHTESLGVVWTSDWTSESVLDVSLPGTVAEAAKSGESERFYWIVETDGASAARRIGPFWFPYGLKLTGIDR